jgi:precorrin-2 dehydrogenase/sirohydrochlorin ferrochelatase
LIVDLNIKGKHAVVIGGGTEGIRKVRGLLGQDCKITVISNRTNRFLIDQAALGKIKLVKAKLRDANILDNYSDAFLVLAATNDRELNRKIIEKGRSIKAERVLRRIIKKADIENARLQEFARQAARPHIKTVGERKEFLYSVIKNREIQNLIKEDKIEDAKSATLELLQKWEKKDRT